MIFIQADGQEIIFFINSSLLDVNKMLMFQWIKLRHLSIITFDFFYFKL